MAVQSTNEINGVQNDDDDAGCSGVDTLRDNEGIDSDITDGTGANSDTCETSGTAPDIAAGVHENPVQPINQKYPVTYFGNKPRSFSSSWFTNNSWLEYSVAKDAIFCYACRLFSKGQKRQEELFVTVGYKDWKHAMGKSGKIMKHSTSMKHKHAMLSWNDFKANQQSSTSIASTLNNARQQLIHHNRQYIHTIIELLLFCAFQEIAIRGHRENFTSKNKGNFLQLLDLVANHDPVIKEKLSNGPKNAIYTSHSIQDELLQIIAKNGRVTICQKLRDAGFFSILADETRDTSKKEQLSFAIRYVDKVDGTIHEHFLAYVHAECLNAEALAMYIKNLVTHFDLDANKMVSQGYDGASVMSGRCTGVQRRVIEFAPNAVYIHCYAHVLNLALVDSVKSIGEASEFFHLLEALYVFVSSSKVHVLFTEKQQQLHPNKRIMELQKLSDTRWACRYAAVNAVCQTYDSLLLTFEEIAESSDYSQVVQAKGLYHQLKSFTFILLLAVFDKILSATKQLSDQLQSSTIDLCSASELVTATKVLLTEYRTSEYWEKIYLYATDIARLHSIDIQPTTRRRKRPCHLTDDIILETVGSRESLSTSEELKIQLYFPILDKFLQELNDRFSVGNIVIMKGIAACSPSSTTFLLNSDLKGFAEAYDIETTTLEVEISLIRTTTTVTEFDSITKFRNYLYTCLPAYDVLFQLAQIALTITVTTAESERSFSTLKRIKTRLRSTMTEERLSDLAFLSIEREVVRELNYEDIINEFASTDKNRRILLV